MRIINLASGSKGNATLIEHKSTKILLDAGVGLKELESRLSSINVLPWELSAILVSHNHIDHIRSVAKLSNKYKIPVYAPRECYLDKNLCGIAQSFVCEIGLDDFKVGDILISTFELPHDALKTLGFVFFANGNKVSVLTDVGRVDEVVLNRIENSNLILIESNYDENMLESGPYPYPLKRRISSNMGHLSNLDCSRLVLELSRRGTQHFMLMHLSEINNTPEIAYNTIMNALYDVYGEENMVKIYMAYQDKISPNFIFKSRENGEE